MKKFLTIVLAVLTVPFHMIQLVYILFSYLSITFLKMSRKFPMK